MENRDGQDAATNAGEGTANIKSTSMLLDSVVGAATNNVLNRK